MRSMLAVERWPAGELPPDKYPECWHLVAGSFEHAAALLVLDADERAAIARARDDVAAEMARRAGDPSFDPIPFLMTRAAGLEDALAKLVVAGRVATLLLALLLSLAASEVASALAGPRFGWIAGLAIGLMPATAHYAATLNTDVPALAWCALAWALAVNAAHGRRLAPFVASGAAMGLAVATKDPLAAMFPGIVFFALARRRGDPIGRGKRVLGIGAGAVASYVLTSGILAWPTWRGHVEFAFGAGSQTYREFEASVAGTFGLLKSIGDRLLAAGGLVGAGGFTLLLAVVVMRRKWRGLWILLPALTYVACFLVPVGYVYPRFALPLGLCGAVAMAWSLANVPGAIRQRQRVWLGGLVAIWGFGEATAVVTAKREDARPVAVAALAAKRAQGELVWVCAQPWVLAPFPPIEGPIRCVSLTEAALEIKAGRPAPRFFLLTVAPTVPMATPEALEASGKRLGLRIVERFETETNAPLAKDPAGLILPTVALFELEVR